MAPEWVPPAECHDPACPAPTPTLGPYVEVSAGTDREFGYVFTLVNAWFVHPQLYRRALGFWKGWGWENSKILT